MESGVAIATALEQVKPDSWQGRGIVVTISLQMREGRGG
jgi:hypothetical protein